MRRRVLKSAVGLCAATFMYLVTVSPHMSRVANSTQSNVIALVPVACADEADLGFSILKCFHPTANFVRASFGEPYQDVPGRMARQGRIDFKGGFTGGSYSMQFVMQTTTIGGDKMMRVVPGADTAPFPPNPSCSYREWSHYN
jgi:hypothetical protein